jgi:hypothetical protein
MKTHHIEYGGLIIVALRTGSPDTYRWWLVDAVVDLFATEVTRVEVPPAKKRVGRWQNEKWSKPAKCTGGQVAWIAEWRGLQQACSP